ncbi:MAG: pksN 10, partial [Acidobacteria bacterium]|nr:pksN 10 [Acidobacteriota bacterium]
GDYLLHPALLDSALHAALGLIDGLSEAGEPRVPFALDSLRIVSPCTREMVAWVRYAPGSQPTDAVVKLDVDLCDESGKVCVQMHGFSSRTPGRELPKAAPVLQRSAEASAPPQQTIGSLLAIPVWQVSAETSAADDVEYAEHHVVLCELPVDGERLRSLLPHAQCLFLQAEQGTNIAERYSDYAVACLERLQSILQAKPQGKVLVQIVVPDQQEQVLFAGLSGLLRTAALEHPKLFAQLILASPELTAEDVARHLEAEKASAPDPVVRYGSDDRQVVRWEAVPEHPEASPIAFRDPGVYLITGGFGGLGVLFAKEILAQTREARVVLTGRSPLTTGKQTLLDGLTTQAGRVTYRQLDLGDAGQVAQLVADTRDSHGRLDGVLHSAGMIADRFLLKKAGTQFREVLAPKVIGTFHLDQATQDLELDFFVLFSSIAGAMGNLGQADYATANGFMDQFAAYRNTQVAAGQRHGRTRSINWPLWQDGGMTIDAAARELMAQATGLQPMQTATGLQAFHRSLALPCDQLLVLEGELARMRRVILAEAALPAEAEAQEPALKQQTVAPQAAAGIDAESLAAKTQAYLRKQFSELMKLPAHKIDPQAPLEEYGIDSILAMKLTSQLEKTFGPLSRTLFFEYQTIATLAGHFAKSHPAVMQEALGLLQQAPKASAVVPPAVEKRRSPSPSRRRIRSAGSTGARHQEIAIVGLAGRYPQAETLQAFWRNLQNGRDCITEVPAERWDHELYFDADQSKAGKSYSKWGGFIADVDKFDPLFFNISPKEASLIDPQERLFLETAWQTIEDAGYTKESIAGSRIGVYVGVMWGQYELYGAESLLAGQTAVPSSSHASIANRVSYFFDLHGPSMALDTMCSSSLTAIHLACEELRRGEIDAAIAGGVNVTIHPYKYLSLSQGKFAASDGRCRSFGAGGDGYVPGEGVGAVLLKPLEHALRDGDQVYAVIKSSTVNHGGKTNGYSVPNPNAQGDLILEALKKANVDPKTLSYIETHGTGTSLGDPIEITGLMKAFGDAAGEKQFCPIGSVKSNIGHLESAAGIAAVTKALLQLRHKQLVPSLHAEPLNPHIDFGDSPFYVQTGLTEWKHAGAHPRRVGVSSFGAGGSNAHLILEEYDAARQPESAAHPLPFVLSAKNDGALRRYAEKVIDFLDDGVAGSLADLAYTSQVGRTPMDARLVVVASSVADLRGKLQQWLALQKDRALDAGAAAAELEDVFAGNVREARFDAGNLIDGPAGKTFLENLVANRELEKIARLWVLGVGIDWSLLDRDANPRRVTLPTYPFARERYWIEQPAPAPRVARVARRIAPATRKAVAKKLPAPAAVVDASTLLEGTEAYLKVLIGAELQLTP